MPKHNWIAGAIKHPGSFTAYCKREGVPRVQVCARKTIASATASEHRQRQAHLAQTLGRLRRGR